MPILTIVLENATDASAQPLQETMPEDLRVELRRVITEKLAEVARKEGAYAHLCKELAQHADPAESVTRVLARTSRSILKAKPDDPLRLKNLFEHKQRLERRAKYEHWLAKKYAEKRKEAQDTLSFASQKVEEYKEKLARTKASLEEARRIYESAVNAANKATFNVIKAKAALEELEKEKP